MDGDFYFERRRRLLVIFLFIGCTLALCWLLMPPLDVSDPVGTSIEWPLMMVLAACIGVCIYTTERMRSSKNTVQIIAEVVSHDQNPKLISDAQGRIHYRNTAAYDADLTNGHINDLLQQHIAEGEVEATHLLKQARIFGAAHDRYITLQGCFEVRVTRLSRTRYVWAIGILDSIQNSDPLLAHLPLICADEKDEIYYINDAAKHFVGADVNSLSDVFETPISGSDPIRMTQTKDGLRPCVTKEIPITESGRQIILIPSMTAEAANRESYFDDLPVAALKISAKGDILVSNQAAKAMLGPTLQEAGHLSDIMEGLGRPMQGWLSEAADKRFQNPSEFLRLRRDDVESFVQVTLGQVIEDAEVSIFAVLQDATELKTLEAQFVQSQKMQAIGQLAGGVAHDFNNLLTAITGHCDLLLLRYGQRDSEFADLTQIKQNAERAAGLVGQLLAFSRKQTLQPVSLGVRDVMSDLTHLLNRLLSEKVTLELKHAPDLRCISVDRQQFEQVIVNIVVNARDAMPDGGTVHLESQNIVLEQPLKRDRATVPAGDYVCITITDQGTGISEDKQQKVFEPFYTTKRTGEGTGLGLSTAYGIVKQSGGFIFLDSTEGQGTEFTLMFPAIENEDCQTLPEATEQIKSEPTGGVVLLVEDEAPVRAFACRALQLQGYTVFEASCGEDALEIVKDSTVHLDLFVTDVVMPGMDGPSWVKHARQSRADVPVIFMSGYAEESFADEKAELSMSSFLPKPFSLTDLTEAVESKMSLSQRLI